MKCAACHTPGRIAPAARKAILMKDLRRTYLGLGTACAACHEDKHNGQVGEKCERCHTVANTAAKWKDVTRFDHSTAKYKLAGAHAKVECAKCHGTLPSPNAASKVVRYTGIPFAQCADCHKDPHRGSFAAACNSCHNDSVWKPAKNTLTAFDHSKTKFPLLGKHAPVTCDKCHKTSDFKAPVAHEQCKACHKDIHGGQFAARADAGDCASCHTADGWKPSTYTVVSHAKSPYPLLGKHAAVTCAKCHPPAGAATRYKVRYQECIDCHRDIHAGQFADAPNQNRCEACHTVDRFQPAKFTLARHNQTRFPLEGGHLAIACGDCHQKRPELHDAVAYKFADLSCTGCHLDPHQPQVRRTDDRRLPDFCRIRAAVPTGLRSLPQRADVAPGGELRSFQDPLRSHRIAPRRGLRGVSPRDRALPRRPQGCVPECAPGVQGLSRGRSRRPVCRACPKTRVVKPVTATSSGSPVSSITSEPVSRWPALMNGCLARIVTAPRRK